MADAEAAELAALRKVLSEEEIAGYEPLLFKKHMYKGAFQICTTNTKPQTLNSKLQTANAKQGGNARGRSRASAERLRKWSPTRTFSLLR